MTGCNAQCDNEELRMVQLPHSSNLPSTAKVTDLSYIGR
jgi:hypothetical protein